MSKLFTCEHPHERIAQCGGSGTYIQVCADCGSHRFLPGDGWIRPRYVEEAMREVLARAEIELDAGL